MTRPAPRKSILAGSSPITPPPTEPTTVDAAGWTHGQHEEVGQKAPQPRKKYPHKVSFYQSPEDTNRVRGAIIHTTSREGPRSLSQFIHQAVMKEVERLEAKYNGGKPFPGVAAGELPQGRPMGE